MGIVAISLAPVKSEKGRQEQHLQYPCSFDGSQIKNVSSKQYEGNAERHGTVIEAFGVLLGQHPSLHRRDLIFKARRASPAVKPLTNLNV